MDGYRADWKALGWAYWLSLGIGPVCAGAALGRMLPESAAFTVLAVTTSLAALLATLTRLTNRRPLWAGLLLIWCLGWLFWIQALTTLFYHFDVWWMTSQYGTPMNVIQGRHGKHQTRAAFVSMLISAGLILGLTRSLRSFLVCALPAVPMALTRLSDIMDGAAAILWHPCFTGALALWAFPDRMRGRPEYLCKQCGYDLRGLEPAAKCPECGSERSGAMAQPDEVG